MIGFLSLETYAYIWVCIAQRPAPNCKKSKIKQKPWDKAEAELIVGEVGWKVGMIVFSPSNSTPICQALVQLFMYKRKNKNQKVCIIYNSPLPLKN